MNRPIPQPLLPIPPDTPLGIPMSPGFRDYMTKVIVFQKNIVRVLEDAFSDLVQVVNTATQGVGDDIASEDVIIVDHAIHRVTGTNTITRIIAPDSFSGPIYLIAEDNWFLGTGGDNPGSIALAVAPGVGQAVCLVYNSVTKVWHPVP